MKKLFPTSITNQNRAAAGSNEGIAGRLYPKLVAKRLVDDLAFREKICRLVKHKVSDFHYVQVGGNLQKRVQSVIGGTTESKTSLRIIWTDARHTNFLVKKSGPAQILLKKVQNFIPEFEAQFHESIPETVKDALLLFVGAHERQREILDSISENYVGRKIRKLERDYNNRLTLASMYGYDETMVTELMKWFRTHAARIFSYCFSLGAARNPHLVPDYLWFHDENEADSKIELFDLHSLTKKLESLSYEQMAPLIRPRDKEQIGSTIDFPFGNLQYHEGALQFRHDRKKICAISRIISSAKNKFGSKPKESGHQNELLIAEALNGDKVFRAHFCERVGRQPSEFASAEADGKHAKQEVSVLGGTTAGKTDLSVLWKDGLRTNVSIKKAANGQVYLVTAKNFVAAFEAQYGVKVPNEVSKALALFIGESPDSKSILTSTNIEVDGHQVRKMEIEQNYRLVYDVIHHYDPRMAEALLAWLKIRIENVFEISFAKGAVADHAKWSHVLWYKNLVDQDGDGLDYMVSISDVILALTKAGNDNEVCRGPKNGGSTIVLPFGHLQYHNKQLEFYQRMKCIEKILSVLSA